MTKSPESAFLVDTSLDPGGRARVMRGLRAVVRLGRLAERAMTRLETEGSFPERAPWLSRTKYGRGFHLKYSRFPSVPILCREDIPWYGPLVIKTGEVWRKEVRLGFSYDCVNILVRAGNRGEDGTWLPANFFVGYIKLNVSASTYFPTLPLLLRPDGTLVDQKQPHSIPLLKNQHHWHVSSVADCIAENISGSRDATPSQAMLFACLSRWLVEDGHAARFLADVRKYSMDQKVVRRVMSE